LLKKNNANIHKHLQARINISWILHHKTNLMMCKIILMQIFFVTNIAQQNTKKFKHCTKCNLQEHQNKTMKDNKNNKTQTKKN
jgi:hypothetical protein